MDIANNITISFNNLEKQVADFLEAHGIDGEPDVYEHDDEVTGVRFEFDSTHIQKEIYKEFIKRFPNVNISWTYEYEDEDGWEEEGDMKDGE